MNDITALALIAKIKKQTESFDTVVLQEGEANALVEALEKAQRANAAHDDHINQQQDRIDVLEKRNAELGKYAGEMERYCIAYMEWSNKTDWVQGDKRFDVVKPLGKHRADVLREYIEHLESCTVTVKLYDDCQLCHYGTTEDYAKGYIDSQNNFIKWLAAAGIKVKGGVRWLIQPQNGVCHSILNVRSANTFSIYVMNYLRMLHLFRFVKRTQWPLATMRRNARNAAMNLHATLCTEG